jgi:SAM-dependent methyltransferase
VGRNPPSRLPTRGRAAADEKFATRDPRLLKAWDEIQRVQTDFCFPQELSAYYMSDRWLDGTRSVLDVGTGNGYFLGHLCRRFPGRCYTGIDVSPELIAIAKAALAGAPVDLATRDFFDLDEVYDFVITRLFWQHLAKERVDEALARLGELTRPGGAALIVDACDELRRFVPDLPEFRKVIAAYSEQQRASGRDRNVVDEVAKKARASGAWRVGLDMAIVMPSTIPRHLGRFRRIYELWIELFEVVGELDVDFAPAKAELARWRENDDAYTQAGLRIVRLDRVAQGAPEERA